MLTVCYAAKGGQGTTTVTAALAVIEASPDMVVVDAGGDLPVAWGMPELGGPTVGLAGFLTGGRPVDADRLTDLAQGDGVGPGLVPVGGPLDAVPAERWAALGAVLRDDERRWLIDAGTTPAARLAVQAQRALLVTTNCYMALQRARLHPAQPTGVVLVQEPERPLSRHDVADVIGAPVVAAITRDPRVASATDAGVLVVQLPDTLHRPLANMTETIR